MPFARTIVLILTFLNGASAFAEQSVCLERTVPVSVYSKDGSPAPQLSLDSLNGTYQKKPVGVKLVALDKRLPRIILLVDTSGSMKIRIDVTMDAAEAVLSKVPPAVEIGLAFFAKDMLPVVLPTTNRVTVMSQLETLRKDRSSFRGRTALWAAIRESVKMFGTAQLGDVIYLISDGGENASKTQERDVEGTLRNAGVRLFALIIQNEGPGLARSPDEESGPVSLEQIVQDTGGAALFPKPLGFPSSQFAVPLPLVDKQGKPTQLGLDLDRHLRHLLDFYRVDIDLPEPVDKPRDWKLDLVGFSKSQRDNLVLMYPTLLLPCR